MTDREKLRVHAQSADHEVVCTSWYHFGTKRCALKRDIVCTGSYHNVVHTGI